MLFFPEFKQEGIRNCIHRVFSRRILGPINFFNQLERPDSLENEAHVAEAESAPFLSTEDVALTEKNTPTTQTRHGDGMLMEPNNAKMAQASGGEACFTEGPAHFVAASDNTKDCLALLVTRELFDIVNEVANYSQQIKIKERTRQKMNDEAEQFKEKHKSKRTLEQAVLAPSHSEIDDLDMEGEIVKQLENFSQQEEESKRELAILENSMKFARAEALDILENAMEDANLLRRPKHQEVEDSSEDQEQSLDLSTGHEDQAPILSNEEQMKHYAKQDFVDTRSELGKAYGPFNNRRFRYDQDMAAFQMEVEQGIADCTQSDFDREQLKIDQDLTRYVIDTEARYLDARRHAESTGAFDDGFGQESYYGDSQCTIQSLPDPPPPETSPARLVELDYWQYEIAECDARCDDTDDVQEVEMQEWNFRPVVISDSCSAIEFEFELQTRIGQWRKFCEDHRDEWQADLWAVRDLSDTEVNLPTEDPMTLD